MGNPTIPGLAGTTLVFTVEGNAAINYANDFANAVAGMTPTNLADTTPSAISRETGGYFVFQGGVPNVNSFNLTVADSYVFVSTGQPESIDISASGQTIGAGFDATITESGDVIDNRIIFEGGNNVFTGSTVAGGGDGDTISGGYDSDTITTGVGSTTVFTGVGSADVTLKDTGPAGAGDLAIINGTSATDISTVYAAGANDTVFASGAGVVVGGSGNLVFVSTDGISSTGSALSPLPVTIFGGTGHSEIFGSAGSDITYIGSSSSQVATIVAGTGNETLNAASDMGGAYYFADTATGASSDQSVAGGSSTYFFGTGGGNEDYSVGSGSTDFFGIQEVNGGVITLADLTSAKDWYLAINGFSQASAIDLVNTGSDVGGNWTVDLGNNASITFVGISSSSQIDNHIV
jgi:hypothetical protein